MGLCVSKSDFPAVPSEKTVSSGNKRAYQSAINTNTDLDKLAGKDSEATSDRNKLSLAVSSDLNQESQYKSHKENLLLPSYDTNNPGTIFSSVKSNSHSSDGKLSPMQFLMSKDSAGDSVLSKSPSNYTTHKLLGNDLEKNINTFQKLPHDHLKKDSINLIKNINKQNFNNSKVDLKSHSEKSLLPYDTYKVLLLGVGESGKSTILKQFKVLHQGGYTKQELLDMKGIIYRNLLDIAADIITARNLYKIPLSDDDIRGYSTITDKELFENILKLNIFDRSNYILDDSEDSVNIKSLPSIFFAYLSILWNSDATQALLQSKHRKNFYLLGNASYFIKRLKDISQESYLPTVDDVLKCRLKTKGVQEEFLQMKDKNNINLYICDVGGQRIQRKNWIYCFSNVSIIIFCVSLSDYDRPLKEDSKVNALSESIELFDSIVNSKWFVNTQVMLFLNKIDLFLQKLPNSPIKNYLPDYEGDDNDAMASVKHILNLLKARNRANLVIYPHITQATDSSNIEIVFTAMADMVLENRLKASGAI
ncbi:hypothetical protein QEN19_000803 [Hanseniaspora menglaensis]